MFLHLLGPGFVSPVGQWNGTTSLAGELQLVVIVDFENESDRFGLLDETADRPWDIFWATVVGDLCSNVLVHYRS